MEEQEPNWKNMVFYGVAWFIACVLLVLALLNTFELVRDILNWITASLDVQKARDFGWTVSAITQGMLFVGGCLAVGLAVGLEYYFRLGEKKGQLFQRVFKVMVIEISVIIVSIVARLLILKFGF
jgi:hypothetical protein